jgi:hypothetical protein
LQGFWLISAQRADPTYMVMVNEFIKGMMLLVERKFLFDFTTIFGEIIRCQIGDVGGERSHSNWLANI